MIVANINDFQKNINNYVEQIKENHQPLVLKGDGGDVVLLSKEQYDEYLKQVRNMEYLRKIDESIEQINSGNYVIKDLIEVADE